MFDDETRAAPPRRHAGTESSGTRLQTRASLLAAALLASCAVGDGPGAVPQVATAIPPSAACLAAPAAALIGRPAPDDAAILRLTNSAQVRRVGPGDVVTQDLRSDRVTVTVDGATGLVVAATCG